jgi:hypothetical protein
VAAPAAGGSRDAWRFMKALRHSLTAEGLDVGYELMPKPLGSDASEWPPVKN